MRNVISYCYFVKRHKDASLYRDRHYEYLLGLLFNLVARDKYFPGWWIYVYVDDIVLQETNQVIDEHKNIDALAHADARRLFLDILTPLITKNDDSLRIKIIYRKFQNNWISTTWRFLPFSQTDTAADDKSHTTVCMVRDLDSILTLTDAQHVERFIKNPKKKLLVYHEYQMSPLSSCGGGFAVKVSVLRPEQHMQLKDCLLYTSPSPRD